ncbi:exodeoxyribonuclease I [Enterobacteriaceae endosymbiont of Donacia bicoloricornis]|uniref:exodeoxyribonuclease I n=1 Tax=Enterobacteriaceae endosymbiont of Donacia bicoloricornis TaxID=2675772 RepID=UPI00144A1A45|nr:exodeoxyribonuclease I [Enterobacteriaceae endosymbiont of Donacia bicoloricornis]QJC37868.1 exodeoxyribonuclease I [Enterobacteriaceae endosymbiont of Donacia bicoloricornis]
MLKKKKIKFSFLFYDYETFGLNPKKDRIAQFACIRTDINLNIISSPIVTYCKLPSDYLPDPNSIIIHNISPYVVNLKGLKENEFAHFINKIFSYPNTCILGYNNINFDDEFSKFLFYRNFYDAYEWFWKNNNSRWDILNLIRACYVLRPNGIFWPKINNIPIFNLEKIAILNNILPYYKSHDALSDVYTTISLTKLVKNKQPLLFKYFFKYKNKNFLIKIINLLKIQILIHISNIYKNKDNNLNCITPLFWHPENKNILITFNLKKKISSFLKILNNKSKIKKEYIFLYIQYINFSKSPLLIPINILKKIDIKRLKFNILFYTENFSMLKKNFLEIKNFIKLNLINFSKKDDNTNIYNVDEQLYKNFFPNNDLYNFKKINDKKSIYLNLNKISFKDKRAKILLFKYKARNFPFMLNHIEKKKWNIYQKNIFNKKFLNNYILKIEKFLQNELCNKKILVLKDLLKYVKELYNSLT